MKILVMKFGGTSLEDIKRINKVATIIKQKIKKYKIIVVLSAMAGTTDNLQKYIDEIGTNHSSDSDLVITAGEQVSVGLLSMILNKIKIKSLSMLGWQVPIITDSTYGKAKILQIKSKILLDHLKKVDVIIVAGFQGISVEGKISSLGRGGSDTTAVALALSVKAERCDIYTDVDGIYSTDPNIDTKAKKIDKISYEEMLEMSSLGAKVMQPAAVQTAMTNNIPVHVRSAFSGKFGTKIISEGDIDNKKAVTGIAYSKKNAKVSIVGVVDKPGVAADVFEPIGKNNINIDMVIQNTSLDGKKANITFTIKQEDLKKTLSIIKKNKKKINYNKVTHDDKLAKVSIIGAGMVASPGVTYKMFRSLADKKINILAISTSEIKVSVLIREGLTQQAVKTLHNTFGLN